MFKRITSLALSAAILLSGGALPQSYDGDMATSLLLTAQAEDTVVYNGDTMSGFSSRTAKDVAEKYTNAFYSGASYVDNDPSTYYKVTASTKSPYNEGVLTDDTLKCMQSMTDFYRWLVGNNTLAVNCEQTPSLQYQALDRNFEFNHNIQNSSKPSDMSQELWDKGFECKHNVLAVGFTPLGAITGWMNEGYHIDTADSSRTGWTSLGHRQIMLHPDHVQQQFGYCGNIAVGSCDFNTRVTSYQPFYAFPSPGYVPSVCIVPNETAWSFGLDTKQIKITNNDNLKVTVTNLSTNASYVCTKANGKLLIDGTDFVGFVQPTDQNTATNKYDSNYKVVVTGLTDVATSKNAQIQYTVKFFDVKDYSASAIKKAVLSFENVKIYLDSFEGTDNLKKLGACLPQTVTITNEFGKTANVKTKGAWTLDEADKCWYNSVDPSDVPVKFVDTNGILKKIKITYEYTDDVYCSYNTLTVSPSKPKENTNVRFAVYTTYSSIDNASILCQINSDDNGNYVCKNTYSSLTSAEFDKQSSDNYNHYYNITATPDDSGQYISIYYSTSEYWNDAYACVMPRTLTVSHDYELKSSKDATCSTEGEKVYCCKVCGKTYTESIPMLVHSYTGSVVPPTCTEPGYTRYTCINCGDTFLADNTPAKGHSFASWKDVTPATCTTEGVQESTCTSCNTTVKKTIPKTEHKWGDWTTIKPATDKTTGTKQRKCTVCGKIETATIPVTTHTHSYTSKVIPPTCTSQGYTEYTCSSCGDVYKNNFTNKTAHKYDSGKITKEATCAATGIKTYTCTVCKATKTETIAKTAHTYTDNVVAPTCASQGYTEHTCSSCGYSYKDKYTAKKDLRAFGPNRYETATDIADHIPIDATGEKKFEKVIVASGTSFADALSASYLAKDGKTPILLVADNNNIIDDVVKYINKYAVKGAQIFIVGGYAAVPGDVDKQLKNKGFKIKRFDGANRYETNIKVLEYAGVEKGSEILVASGLDYADALSASAVGKPIFLVAGKALLKQQKDYLETLKGNKITATMIGGTGAVSSEISNQIMNYVGKSGRGKDKDSRIGGNNRYETSKMVADEYFPSAPTIALAYGLNYPDGLCGGPLAMAYKCPLLLTSNNNVNMSYAKAYAKAKGITSAIIFGGKTLISETAVDTILGR